MPFMRHMGAESCGASRDIAPRAGGRSGHGAGILLAVAVTVLTQALGGFLSLIMWAVAGFLIGQAVHIAANRSRAPTLRFVAGGAAVFSWAVALLIGGIAFTLFGVVFAVIQLAIAITLAITPFR